MWNPFKKKIVIGYLHVFRFAFYDNIPRINFFVSTSTDFDLLVKTFDLDSYYLNKWKYQTIPLFESDLNKFNKKKNLNESSYYIKTKSNDCFGSNECSKVGQYSKRILIKIINNQ